MSPWLKLGRVSNLPTVWTNGLVGIVLAGGALYSPTTLLVLLALSLFYTGGMLLNDAFDAEIDALERPERPIPKGEVARGTVFLAGFSMLLGGVALLVAASPAATLCGLLLAFFVLLYNWRHKGYALSPVVMGLCRFLSYLTAGLAVTASLPASLVVAAFASFAYLVGLTYVAKREQAGSLGTWLPLAGLGAPFLFGLAQLGLWPLVGIVMLGAWVSLALTHLKKPGGVPRTVIGLIAGIALVDALFLATAGRLDAAVIAVLCFGLTLYLQRWVRGT